MKPKFTVNPLTNQPGGVTLTFIRKSGKREVRNSIKYQDSYIKTVVTNETEDPIVCVIQQDQGVIWVNHDLNEVYL